MTVFEKINKILYQCSPTVHKNNLTWDLAISNSALLILERADALTRSTLPRICEEPGRNNSQAWKHSKTVNGNSTRSKNVLLQV